LKLDFSSEVVFLLRVEFVLKNDSFSCLFLESRVFVQVEEHGAKKQDNSSHCFFFGYQVQK